MQGKRGGGDIEELGIETEDYRNIHGGGNNGTRKVVVSGEGRGGGYTCFF